MTKITLKAFAEAVEISIDRLIQQFSNAGIHKTDIDYITQKEKELLLTYLNCNQQSISNELTLQRKTRSTFILNNNGKSKSIQIEIRKKHTYFSQNANIQLKQEEIDKISSCQIKDIINNTSINKNSNKIDYSFKKENIQISHSHDHSTKTTTKTPLEVSEKLRLINESNNLQRKVEEEIQRKVEEEARKIAENAKHIAEKHHSDWNQLSEIIKEDLADEPSITSYHVRMAAKERDRNIEDNRRHRFKDEKFTKKKRNNRIFDSKNDREEMRSVNRNYKYIKKINPLTQSFNKPMQSIMREVNIGETITVSELSNRMAIKSSEIIKAMMKLGKMITINQILDQKTAQLLAEDMGHKVILISKNALEESVMSDRDTGIICLSPRAPIVTIMGHVDHGKTSLIDYIRSTKIASKEAGGITQHIGAYHVKTKNGMITFLDTPGHSAFTAMRARGVQVTDIVVLIIAVDDGVMPQTIEAIQHAQAAKVPIIVAINKIDKSDCDVDRIKKELIKYSVIPEEWGGDNQFVYISVKMGIGIDDLLNAIILQAEILELQANLNSMASGVVIESCLDKGLGPVVTVLVREGTLHIGDIVLCGLEYGKVRAIKDQTGHNICSAGPSIPVEILGLSGVASTGEEMIVVRNEKKAREVALYRQEKYRDIKLSNQYKHNLENSFSKTDENAKAELNVIIKSDVQGSSEAISNALEQLSITTSIKIKIIMSGVGIINETDAMLASASNAILIGFNVRVDSSAKRIIEENNLNLRCYSIIYHLVDEIKQMMHGMLLPNIQQKIIGLIEVRNVFRSLNSGSIAGCMVTEGTVKRTDKIRMLRNNTVIYEGELASLRRFKNDVNEVQRGMECGIGIKNYHDVRIGDIIEIYEINECKRSIV